jgi:hypothetical protein
LARIAIKRMAPDDRGHCVRVRAVTPSSIATDAVRPEDDPAAGRYDAFPHNGTVGPVSVVFGAVVAIAVSRTHAEAERADLDAGAAGVRAHVNLSRGGNRRNEGGGSRRGKQQFPHRILLFPLISVVNAARRQALHGKKILKFREPRLFRAAPRPARKAC